MGTTEDLQAQELRNLQTQHLDELKKGAEPWKPEQESALLLRLKRKVKLAVKQGLPAQEKAIIGGYPFVSSDADLDQLQQMDLTDMYLRGTHRGGFLLCRVLPRPANLSLLHSPLNLNLNLPVASPDGSAALLRLHNYSLLPSSLGRPTSADIDAAFPPGTMLAILEPTVRRDVSDGEWVVWVDAASDVVLLKEGDSALEDVDWIGSDGNAWKPEEEVLKELDEWKDEGNKAFAARRFLSATSLYTKGINQHPTSPSLHLVLLNRSQAFLRLEQFSNALSDANQVITLLSSSTTTIPSSSTTSLLEKAIVKKSNALYSLRRWNLALASFSHLLTISPSLPEALSGISSCRARITEASSGDYDIPSLYAQSLAAKGGGVASIQDVADFIGPVEIAPIANKGGGRGLVATRDVHPGEVLLAVRAVALVSATDLPTQTKLVVLNLEEMVRDTSNSLFYVHNVLYRLRDQPELVCKIYDLYLGPKVEETPSTFDLHAPKEEEERDASRRVKIDRGEDISRAIYYNASVPFKVLPVPAGGGDSIGYGAETSPAALFSESAMANHSCSWNAFHCFFGDFQITRATTFIPSGSEVLASYTPDLPHTYRTPRLAKFFPDPCSCPLCTSDLLSPTLSSRPGILVKIMRSTEEDLEKMSVKQLEERLKVKEGLMQELRGTYEIGKEVEEKEKEGEKRDQVDLFFGFEAMRGVLREIARRSKGKERKWRAVVENEIGGVEALGGIVRRPSPGGSSESVDALEALPRYRHAEATRSLILIAGYLEEAKNAGVELVSEFGEVEEWIRAARRVEEVTVGGGRDFFEMRWWEVLLEQGLGSYLLEKTETKEKKP